jgi:hypothetical protein
MNSAERRFVPLGTHQISVEGDTVIFVAHGMLTVDDLREILNIYWRIKETLGQLFVFYDCRGSTGIDPEARKMATMQPRTKKQADLQVAFGISFTIRVVLNMIMRAQKVLRNREVTMHFWDNEATAWSFFQAERARLRQEKQISTFERRTTDNSASHRPPAP